MGEVETYQTQRKEIERKVKKEDEKAAFGSVACKAAEWRSTIQFNTIAVAKKEERWLWIKNEGRTQSGYWSSILWSHGRKVEKQFGKATELLSFREPQTIKMF